MNRNVLVISLLLLPCQVLAQPLGVDEAVDRALGVCVTIAEAEAELGTARGERRERAFLANNPEIGIGVAVFGDLTDADIAQPISLSGEGIAASQSARKRVLAAEQGLNRARVEVAAEVRGAYTWAAFAQQQAAFSRDALELATRLRQAVEAQFEVGNASELDLRLARLDESRAARDALVSLQDEGAALGALRALVPDLAGVVELNPDPASACPIPDRLVSETERSDLQAAGHRIEAARAGLRRERAAVLPPVVFGAFLEKSPEGLAIGPSIGLSLPLWSHNDEAISEARGALRTATAQRAELERRAASEQATSARRMTLAEDVEALQESDLLNDAIEALAGIETAYRSGSYDLITALLARSQVLEGQSAYLESRALLAQTRIDYLLARDDSALLPASTKVQP